jgi:hypothetical protein
MRRESDERGAYVWSGVHVRRRDHLPAERLTVTEDPEYSNDWGNARYMGKGSRAAQMGEYSCCTGGYTRPRKMN